MGECNENLRQFKFAMTPPHFFIHSFLLFIFLFLFKGSRNYIINRKKNISISIVIIVLLKPIVHFFFRSNGEVKPYLHDQPLELKWHFENIFYQEVYLFIPIIIIYLIIIWFFNDRIKAR